MRSLLAAILIATLAPLTGLASVHAQGRAATASPVLTLSQQQIVPGHDLKITGKNFTAGQNLTVKLTVEVTGPATTETVKKDVTAGAQGTFSTTLRVPLNATPNTYNIYAYTSSGAKLAQSPLKVVTGIWLGTPVITAGKVTSIKVNGAGFRSSQKVTISYAAKTASAIILEHRPITAGVNGAFSTTLAVPSGIVPGPYAVHAVGADNQPLAQTMLRAVLVRLSSSNVAPGQKVTIYGAGFTPNKVRVVYVTLHLAGSTTQQTYVLKPTTNSSGNFTTQLTVPKTAQPGTYTVHISTSTSSSDLTHVSLTVHAPVTASLSVSTAKVLPGAAVTVTGKNFGANSNVTISATVSKLGGGTMTVRTTARTNGSGAFSTKFNIPSNAAPGKITILATGVRKSATVTARVGLTVLARQTKVSVSAASIRPGGTITVSGSGFGANVQVTVRATVPLHTGGTRVVTVSARTNGTGTFTTKLAIPAQASASTIMVLALGPHHHASTRLRILALQPSITVSPSSAVPGSTVTVTGHGYLPGSVVNVKMVVRLTNGSTTTLQATAKTNASGAFQTQVHVPSGATSGTYQVTATSRRSGRAPTARLIVVKLTPSLVAAPTTTAPGSTITVNGFGFAGHSSVTLTINGQTIKTVTAGANGQFSTQITLPANLASGSYSIKATSRAGRAAAAHITLNRAFSTHFYFGALYTGHREYLRIMNPTSITARVTITYQKTSGNTVTRSFQVAGHHTYTRNVNADLGPHVSAAATVSADVAIAASRVNFQKAAGDVVPGEVNQSKIWYFATGNTGGKYREYLAVQNTNHFPVQLSVRLMPQHHKAFTIYRSIPATSRKTLKINKFVKHDAVGLVVRASSPIVANRTIKVLNGVNSKDGAKAPSNTWYFAGGERNPAAHDWLNITNPNAKTAYTTITAYSPGGSVLRTKHRWLKPNARVGILMSQFAGRNDVAVKITANRPLISELTTYVGRRHSAETDTFGVRAPTTTRMFPAAGIQPGSGPSGIELFNPTAAPAPILVQFVTADGRVIKRTYVVNPFAQTFVSIANVVPNAQVGVVATSSRPFVGLSWNFFNGGIGATMSAGLTP